ncbi:MAG: DMT family transporter [Clostridiales bacterium]|nr:DMT family transporter [Clostridiales bacterium]
MRSKAMRSNLLLILTAAIWGFAFTAQSVGMDYVGPFTFNAARSFIAALVLFIVICAMKLIRSGKNSNLPGADALSSDAVLSDASCADVTTDDIISVDAAFSNADSDAGISSSSRRTLIIGGICCGVCLTVATCLQQVGIGYTTVGKAGFITAMYVVLVPILGLFIGKRARLISWISVGMAVVGLWLLCMSGSLSLGIGDLLVLICAFFFAVYILIVDYFSPKVDCVKMSCIQFLTCGIISAVPTVILEHPTMSSMLAAWLPILYAGALSSAVGYTLQIVAQKNTDPVVASLIMSLESVFSLLGGWLLLHERLSSRELCGCLIIFAAIIITQLPIGRRSSQ